MLRSEAPGTDKPRTTAGVSLFVYCTDEVKTFCYNLAYMAVCSCNARYAHILSFCFLARSLCVEDVIANFAVYKRYSCLLRYRQIKDGLMMVVHLVKVLLSIHGYDLPPVLFRNII